MHAREWFAVESCYALIQHLLDNYTPPGGFVPPDFVPTEVDELLAHVDVWVLPQTNPAGRHIDDPAHGDPNHFAYMCRGGADEGDICAVDGECASGDCSAAGWRTNANRSQCGVAIDLARNWSSGWDQAAATCITTEWLKWRGPDPFSEPETRNLRRFIHNHMISTVAIVHGPQQQIWNMWANDHTASSTVVDRMAAINSVAAVPDGATRMPRDSVGNGLGQFSAWLSTASNRSGDLDDGTERNISTFFLEVPVLGSQGIVERGGQNFVLGGYSTLTFNGLSLQENVNDTSNNFHLSGAGVPELWTDTILPVLLEVIRQARSPHCPVDADGDLEPGFCAEFDFGLSGAKIADASDGPGRLEVHAPSREERLDPGTHRVVYAVQNGGALTTQTTATVKIDRDGANVATENQAVDLVAGARGVFEVEHNFAPGAYEVRIEIDPADAFWRNDRKVFAFRVPELPLLPPPPTPLFEASLTLPAAGGAPDFGFDATVTVLDAAFLRPDLTGVDLTLHIHRPATSSVASSMLAVSAPPGSPGWDTSQPALGIFEFTDPTGGAIQLLRLAPSASPAAGSALEVLLDPTLAMGIEDANAYTMELGFGDDALLVAHTVGTSPVLPAPSMPPEDDEDDEPDVVPEPAPGLALIYGVAALTLLTRARRRRGPIS